MKKLVLLGLLIVCMCSLAGCDGSEAIDGAVNQSIEHQKDAREAVSEFNENVEILEDTADKIEEE